MDKEYRKVIISIIIIVVIVVGIGVFWRYKQETKFSPLEKDIISFLEKYILSEYDQARLSHAVNALKENPEDASALMTVGSIRYRARDLDGALGFYLKVLKIQPTNVTALNDLIDIYDQKREREKSAEIYLRLTENAPEQISSYRSLMSIYKNDIPKKYPDMEQILLTGIEKISEITEDVPIDLYSMLGEFYRETGDIDKSIEYFEIVLKLMPNEESVKMEIERLKELK